MRVTVKGASRIGLVLVAVAAGVFVGENLYRTAKDPRRHHDDPPTWLNVAIHVVGGAGLLLYGAAWLVARRRDPEARD